MLPQNEQPGGERARFALISVPIWYGAGKRGTELCPPAFKKFGLDEKLRMQGVKVVGWYQVDPDTVKSADSGLGKVKYEEEIFYTQKSVFRLLRGFVEQEIIPVVLGGDHTISIASVAAQAAYAEGARKVGIIWIDAHGDVHTPDTTPSGNVHGMPLAILLGEGSERLMDVGGEYCAKIYPRNVIHIGSNNLEKEEADFFMTHKIPLFPQSGIASDESFARACHAISALGKSAERIVLSIDMDAFDETIAPGVHARNKNGIKRERAIELFDYIKSHCRIVGIDIAEIVPRKDRGHKTIELAYNFLVRLLAP